MKQQGHTLSRRQALAASVAAVGSTAVAVAVPALAHTVDPFARLLADYIRAEFAYDAAARADDATDETYYDGLRALGDRPTLFYYGNQYFTVEDIERLKLRMTNYGGASSMGTDLIVKVPDERAIAEATATQEKMQAWDQRDEEIRQSTGKARTEAAVLHASASVSEIADRIRALTPTTALGSYARLRAEWFDIRYRADRDPEVFAAFRAAMSGLEAALGLPPAPGNPHTAEA